MSWPRALHPAGAAVGPTALVLPPLALLCCLRHRADAGMLLLTSLINTSWRDGGIGSNPKECFNVLWCLICWHIRHLVLGSQHPALPFPSLVLSAVWFGLAPGVDNFTRSKSPFLIDRGALVPSLPFLRAFVNEALGLICQLLPWLRKP